MDNARTGPISGDWGEEEEEVLKLEALLKTRWPLSPAVRNASARGREPTAALRMARCATVPTSSLFSYCLLSVIILRDRPS
jgi:hypothetical protein